VTARIVVIVQARTSSTRLPDKVLLPLAGAPSLVRLMERVGRVATVDERLVATSTDPTDDRVEALCLAHGIRCLRGPLADVLARYHMASVATAADVVVRITGDCPLVDPGVVNACIGRFLEDADHVDYCSNVDERTFPVGLDVEVVSFRALDEAYRQAGSPSDREHVTPYIRRHARKCTVAQDVDLSDLRWTLDYSEDHAVIAAIYAALYPRNPCFTARDVYALLLERPELVWTRSRGPLDATETQNVRARIEQVLRTP
jgi:spore coat polysaccharide biosynthesis protein SpsF (cytidylyltransferase family)